MHMVINPRPKTRAGPLMPCWHRPKRPEGGDGGRVHPVAMANEARSPARTGSRTCCEAEPRHDGRLSLPDSDGVRLLSRRDGRWAGRGGKVASRPRRASLAWRAAPISPSAARSICGSAVRVPMLRVRSPANRVHFLHIANPGACPVRPIPSPYATCPSSARTTGKRTSSSKVAQSHKKIRDILFLGSTADALSGGGETILCV